MIQTSIAIMLIVKIFNVLIIIYNYNQTKDIVQKRKEKLKQAANILLLRT
jgi:hypothetical protein